MKGNFPFISKGPNEDQDQEIDMEEVQQMKREREERKSQIAEEDVANEDDDEEEGISWGMGIYFLLLDSFRNSLFIHALNLLQMFI